MKHLLLTTIAAVVLVGCGPSTPDITIHEAAGRGDIQAVKQQLAVGADANAKSDALNHAATFGQKEVAELLIDSGADVNVMDAIGQTPLHGAATGGHKEVAELLITKGADVNAKVVSGAKQGMTSLDLALFNQHTKLADLLRKHGGKTGDWFKAGESIHIATRAGHIEAVKQHLAAGAEVNAKDDGGATPLYWTQTEEIAELLIAKGADVNAKDEDEWTPLHWAAINGHKEVTELLIANGADMNAKQKGGRTPLHYAAKNGHKDVAELLIAEGADVNAKMEDGWTPLDMAIGLEQPETADLLRKHGGKTGAELKAEGK